MRAPCRRIDQLWSATASARRLCGRLQNRAPASGVAVAAVAGVAATASTSIGPFAWKIHPALLTAPSTNLVSCEEAPQASVETPRPETVEAIPSEVSLQNSV